MLQLCKQRVLCQAVAKRIDMIKHKELVSAFELVKLSHSYAEQIIFAPLNRGVEQISKFTFVHADVYAMVGGSLAFYYHYPEHIGTMNDIDITLYSPGEDGQSPDYRNLIAYVKTQKHKSYINAHEEVVIMSYGKADIHLSNNQQALRKSFLGCEAVAKEFFVIPGDKTNDYIKVMGKKALYSFYKSLNRDKDAFKLSVMRDDPDCQ